MHVEVEVDYTEPSVIFGVQANEAQYSFTYAAPGKEPILLGKGETSFLSKEVAGGFTGVYFALYATGNGKPAKAPARFDDFNYRVLEEKPLDFFSILALS